MRRTHVLLAWAALSGATAAAANPNPLQTACVQADAVVVGVIEPVSWAEPPRFTLNVEAVIKGDVPVAGPLLVGWPGSSTSARVRPDHYRALWFLRTTASRGWEITPVGGPNAPLYASGLAVSPSFKDEDGAPQTGSCYEAVSAVLKETAPHVDESPVYLTALETLLQSSPEAVATVPGANAAVQTFSRSASPDLRALALAFNIRGEDIASLVQVANQANALSGSKVGHQLALALAAWRSSDAAGVVALGAISQVTGAEPLSGAAAEALMMVHTKEAVRPLIALLSKSDARSQNIAVRGLSLFVRGAPVLTAENLRAMAYMRENPNRDLMDAAIPPYVTITPVPAGQETEYVDAWLSWWNRMAAKLQN